jgi:hypothetical protein
VLRQLAVLLPVVAKQCLSELLATRTLCRTLPGAGTQMGPSACLCPAAASWVRCPRPVACLLWPIAACPVPVPPVFLPLSLCPDPNCPAMPLPLPAVMEEGGYAANGLKHCVRPMDMTGG